MKSLDADKKASKTSEAAPAAAEVKAEPEKIDFSSFLFVMLCCAISIKLSSLHHHS